MPDPPHPLREQTTRLFERADGEPPALGEVFDVVYDELRRMARARLAREPEGHTLQPTALVHEAWLKLVDATRVSSRGRAYFFAAAARAMRQVLVDHARRVSSLKRGGGFALETLDEGSGAVTASAIELLELHDALERLATRSPRPAQVVECRYFGGLSVPETAEALGVSPRTVKSDWALARAWLHRELEER